MPLGGGPGGRERFALFRADDRLLHGQVALAWGRQLRPRSYLLIDDALAADPASSEIYQLSAPGDCAVAVLSLAEMLGSAPLRFPARETVLLVRDLAGAARLLRGGIPGPLNLGGIHVHPGARQILGFLFLTPEEEALLAELVCEGHEVYAQDLPQNPRQEAGHWLTGRGRAR